MVCKNRKRDERKKEEGKEGGRERERQENRKGVGCTFNSISNQAGAGWAQAGGEAGQLSCQPAPHTGTAVLLLAGPPT